MRSTFLCFAGLGLALPLVLAAAACSGGATGSGGGSSTQTGAGGGSATTGAFGSGSGGGCPVGTQCSGGVCDETGQCCPTAQTCGTKCCGGGGAICSFLQCVVPGVDCTDSSECAATDFCDFSHTQSGTGGGGGALGGMCSGSTAPTGKCLPKPPVCPNGMDPGNPPTCVTSCEYHPPVGVFTPELKYFWGVVGDTEQNVMMSPIVVQLDDDNCDGKIDAKDIPEIVFFTFAGGDYNNASGTSSTLHAISIVNGVVVEKLTVSTDGASADAPGRQIAAGNLDSDPAPEIVTCTKDQRLRAYKANGTVKWTSAPTVQCFMPSIADLDHDGKPEVIDAGIVLDGDTGATKATFANEFVVVSDVMGDDKLEIVGSRRIYAPDGTVLVDSGVVGTHPAVGDLDKDGIPEIVTVDFPTHTVSVWHPDATQPGGFKILRQGLDINDGIAVNTCCVGNPASAGCTHGGGPPTIARFNADEFPDVGFAGGIGYVALDGKKLVDGTPASQVRIWLTPTQDCSSAQTGSSVFDFDGDGIAEVIYGDEIHLHIYSGPTGTELFSTCNTSGTLWEYPLVADVDNDGHADIIVASNFYSGLNCGAGAKTTGIRVFGDKEGKWVRTRRIWNEHAYHVTNVNEDGSIPVTEAKNYTTVGLDNFRQNVQPSGQFSAPDLVVTLAPICSGSYGLRARVTNIGEAPVDPGVVVGFYLGTPPIGGTSLGQGTTQGTLYPLSYEDVDLPLASVPMGQVYAVVDDGMPVHPWHECRIDNNVSAATDPKCGVPQ